MQTKRIAILASIIILVPCSVFYTLLHKDLLFHYGTVSFRFSFTGGGQEDIFPGIWVDPYGLFLQRIEQFLKQVEEYRDRLWSQKEGSHWRDVNWRKTMQEATYINIDPVHQGYLQNVTQLDRVRVIFLRWREQKYQLAYWTSVEDTYNILLQDYHNWIADYDICEWAKIRGLVHAPWGYRTRCSVVKDIGIQPAILYEEYLNVFDRATSLYDFSFEPNLGRPPPFVTYLQIFEDVVITKFGHILTPGVKVIPYPCEWNYKADGETVVSGDFELGPVVKEVFTFAQHTGAAVYHANIESIPRIAFYIDFLINNPDIRIHTGIDEGGMTKSVLEVLGIFRHRLVTGFVKAQVAYVPEGVPCGSVNLHYAQLMNLRFREKISEKFGKLSRDSVVLIKRTNRRKLLEFDKIENAVKTEVESHGLELVVYSDSPSPSLEDSMKLFRRAVFIIGSHGAGLYNMIYSEPGTYVLEILNSVPRLVMCFQNLAYSLGHRYYGMTGSGADDINIELRHFKELLKFYVPHAANLKEI